jgi:hypothetical protein
MTVHRERSPGARVAPTDTGRAVRLEIALQRPLLWGCGVVALIVLLLAGGQIIRLGVVPLMLAVMAPVGAGPRDGQREAMLRGILGISRAAHVLARTRLVVALQLVLLLFATVTILIGPHAARGGLETSPWRTAGASAMLPSTVFWSDVLLFSSAVLWSHLAVGRDALCRCSTLLWVRALVSFLGMWVVSAVVAGGAAMLITLGGTSLGVLLIVDQAAEIGLLVAAGLMLGGGLLGLHWRSHVWADRA